MTSVDQYSIRIARSDDLPYLPAVEVSAAKAFAAYPELAFLEQDEPMSVTDHERSLDKWSEETGSYGGTWLAVLNSSVSRSEEIVGFIATSLESIGADSATTEESTTAQGTFIHIHELGVQTEHQRKGLASRLMKAVKDYAGSMQPRSAFGLTLITMLDVSFNGPFYSRQGFRIVPADLLVPEIGGWAVKVWNDDQARFSDIKDRRCFMVCRLNV